MINIKVWYKHLQLKKGCYKDNNIINEKHTVLSERKIEIVDIFFKSWQPAYPLLYGFYMNYRVYQAKSKSFIWQKT